MYKNHQHESKNQNRELSGIRLDFRPKWNFGFFYRFFQKFQVNFYITTSRVGLLGLIIFSANYIAKNYSPMSAGDKLKIPSRFIKRFIPEFTQLHNAIQNFQASFTIVTSINVTGSSNPFFFWNYQNRILKQNDSQVK